MIIEFGHLADKEEYEIWEVWLNGHNCCWHWITDTFDLGNGMKVEWKSAIEIDDEDCTAFMLKFKL
jgi:hypothetical protein